MKTDKLSSWCVAVALLGGASSGAVLLSGCDKPPANDIDAATIASDTGSTPEEDAAIVTDDDAGEPEDAGADAGTVALRFSATEVLVTSTLTESNHRECIDIDLVPPGPVDCDEDADAWDYMFEYDADEYVLWTNSGQRGSSTLGASFGPMSDAERRMIPTGRRMPGWFPDTIGGVFSSAPWHGYDLHGTHDITPNYRVYVIDTGTALFRVQITSYYRDGESGWVTVRFGRLGEATYDEVTLDARAGGFGAAPEDPLNNYAYLDLDTGTVVPIDDAAAATNTVWDLGFKRFGTITNGGIAGPGMAMGAVADAQWELYDANRLPLVDAFDAMTPEQALADFLAVTTADGLTFELDRSRPYIINDGGVQSFLAIDRTGGDVSISARPDVYWAIRGAGGDSYAWLHATAFDPLDATITLGLYIQPRPSTP